MTSSQHETGSGVKDRGGLVRRLVRWGLPAVALLLLLALPLRHFSRAHLSEMVRDPDAGLGSCLRCHGAGVGQPRPLLRGDAASPLFIAVLPDRGELLVTAEREGSLYRLDPASGRVVGRIDVGHGPHGAAVFDGRQRALVSLRDEDVVVVVDLESRRTTSRIRVGLEPTKVAVAPRWGLALVANTGSDDISVVHIEQGKELYRLAAGREPYGIAVSPDQDLAVVSNRLSNPHRTRTTPHTELTLIRLSARPRVIERRRLESLHLSEAVAITPDRGLALATATATRNLLPTTQVGRGWITSDVLVVAELGGAGRTIPIILDDSMSFHADLADLVVSPDGTRAYLSSGGGDHIIGLDLVRLRGLLAQLEDEELAELGSRMGPGAALITDHIPTRWGPRGLAISADGSLLYVAERLSDSVAVIDRTRARVLHRIELGRQGPCSERLLGERAFHRATAYQGQFSCRSCHPDGHLDGLSYDFGIDGVGENFLDNRSLRGLAGTDPYKWIGLNPSIEVQCGPRFVKVLGRAEPFSDEEMRAMRVYIESLPGPGSRRESELSPEAHRGKDLFFRTRTNDGRAIAIQDRCHSCHPPPLFTSHTRSRVGTAAQTDFSDVFDAPHLLDIRLGAPYLHDGRALTLHELFLRYNPEDRHGRTQDLSRLQINDLVEYLRTL